MAGYTNPELLMTAADLARALEEGPRPLVIDLRPAEEFAGGHIIGAVHLDLWGVSLIDTERGAAAAFMWMVDHLFTLSGVDADDVRSCVYDERLRHPGRARLLVPRIPRPPARAVLDGGFGGGSRAGLPVTTEPPRRHPSTWARRSAGSVPTRDVAPGAGSARQAETAIVDTRSDAELRRSGPREARRRDSRAPSTSNGRRTSRRTARCKAAGELRRDVRGSPASRPIGKW